MAIRNKRGQFVKGNTPWCKGTKGVVKAWNKNIKGLHFSPSTEFKKGESSPKKGIHQWFVCKGCNKDFYPDDQVKRAYCSKECLTKYFVPGLAKIGIPNTWSNGEKSNLWKGGISKKNKSERQLAMETIEYKKWRRDVFERDNYTCQSCKKYGINLNADHIKPWILFPKLRYDLNNGRTLCVDCHYKIGWKGSHLEKGGNFVYA